MATSKAFPVIVILFQALLFIIWAFSGDYAVDADGKTGNDATSYTPISLYSAWIGVHIMMLFGFGNLMTFLHRYGYSAIGYTFLITCLGLQWGIIIYDFCHGVLNGKLVGPTVDVAALFQGDFAVAAVLISFGAVLGKTSPTQLVWMCALEIIFYAISETIISEILKAEDVGGSIVIHTFGAYFGLVVSKIVTPPDMTSRQLDRDNKATGYSDMLAIIGTLFLFIYWPSFNGGLLDSTAHAQERALVNTVISLAGSCAATFVFSKLLRGHFDMVDVQNATLAGGVAVGSTCNMMIHPAGALAIGLAAGTLSTIGFAKIQPYLAEAINLQDTCGVNNLHGMPGIFGGLMGVIAAVAIPASAYGGDITSIYGARADGRSAAAQAGLQFTAIVTAVAIAVLGGLITGKIMLMVPGPLPPGSLFIDDADWEVPDKEEHATSNKNGYSSLGDTEQGHLV